MKLISTILLLLGSAAAQTQPFAFSEVSAYKWQGKNVASKEILAYVIEFESPMSRSLPMTITSNLRPYQPERLKRSTL